MPSDELKLTTQEELLEKYGNRIWDIKAVYELNRTKISAWLEEHANSQLAGYSDGNEEKKKETIKRAKNYYASLSNTLDARRYNDGRVDTKLIRDAEDGKLQRNAPSTSTIWLFWFLILCLTGGLELTFFSYMVFFKGAGWMLIAIAILLLAGGLFTGSGFSRIMLHRHISEEKYEKKHIWLIVVGIILIAGSVTARAVFGGALAAIVAVFFGLAVTTTETFWGYSKEIRTHYLDEMFRAQGLYADIHHSRDMGEKGKHDDDTWFPIYKGFIQSITRTIIDITSSEEA